MSTVRLYEAAVTTETVTGDVVRLYELGLTATPGTVRLYELSLTAMPSIEPFATVTLPPGTWTQTAGASVTITGGTFVAPATVAGDVLTFTSGSGGGSVSYRALPHTLWTKSGANLVPLKV